MVLILGANLQNPSPEAWVQEKLTADRDACGCKPILLPQDPTWKIQHQESLTTSTKVFFL